MTTEHIGAVPTTAAPRVLVYLIGSLGDTVVTIPALRALREHYGDAARIDVLQDAGAPQLASPAAILAGENLVSEFISYDAKATGLRRLTEISRLFQLLRQHRYDVGVYLVDSDRTASQTRRDRAFFRLAGVRRLIGFSNPAGHEASAGNAAMHESEARLLRLSPEIPHPSESTRFAQVSMRLPASAVKEAQQWLAANRQFASRPLVAICPGTKQRANAWPLERFAEIGRRLASDRSVEIVVVGGPAEAAIGGELIAQWGCGINAAGALSVLGSAALFQSCQFVVGLNTGTTHLAASGGVPCVAIYGSRDVPGRWDPVGAHVELLRHSVACEGCRHRECPIANHPCMSGIEVDAVWDAITRLRNRLQ